MGTSSLCVREREQVLVPAKPGRGGEMGCVSWGLELSLRKQHIGECGMNDFGDVMYGRRRRQGFFLCVDDVWQFSQAFLTGHFARERGFTRWYQGFFFFLYRARVVFPFYLTASSFVSYSLLLISPWGSSAALVWYLIASFHLVYRQCPRLPGVSILCSKSKTTSGCVSDPNSSMIASRWSVYPI